MQTNSKHPIWGSVSHTRFKQVQCIYMRNLRSALKIPWFVGNKGITKSLRLPSINEVGSTMGFNVRHSLVHHFNSCINSQYRVFGALQLQGSSTIWFSFKVVSCSKRTYVMKFPWITRASNFLFNKQKINPSSFSFSNIFSLFYLLLFHYLWTNYFV